MRQLSLVYPSCISANSANTSALHIDAFVVLEPCLAVVQQERAKVILVLFFLLLLFLFLNFFVFALL